MEKTNTTLNEPKEVKKEKKKDDILEVVKQFITYFEETDRSQNNDYSI